MSKWAIDLGTTNTVIGQWDSIEERPILLHLSGINRHSDGTKNLEPRIIPSATHLLPQKGFWSQLRKWPAIQNKYKLSGQPALIGQQAIDANKGHPSKSFVPSFKHYLGQEALRVLARCNSNSYTARDIAQIYMRELLEHTKQQTKERIRELVMTVPVDSFESYRAELSEITKRLGVRQIRFLDEPVAAAIGYGLHLKQEQKILVLDFGGGTLDLALVSLTAHNTQEGHCQVIAKTGRRIGGNHVDQWILEDVCEQLGYPLQSENHHSEYAFWLRTMRNEAKRVKETLYFQPSETFYVLPPEELRHFEARLHGKAEPIDYTKEQLIELLQERKLFDELASCLDDILKQAKEQGIAHSDIEEVLLVGGSTLLPQVYTMFEESFGRNRIRAWQPFEAIAYGACAFAGNYLTQSDFLVHSYAIRTYHPKTKQEQYEIIIPKGTRIPTSKDFWKRQLVPACALGEPETIFKLIICEICEWNEHQGDETSFGWDAQGNAHQLGTTHKTKQLIVPLNESHPVLGQLNPAHQPDDRTPRLQISFGVNVERWLCATVFDLKTQKTLMQDEPVIRLL